MSAVLKADPIPARVIEPITFRPADSLSAFIVANCRELTARWSQLKGYGAASDCCFADFCVVQYDVTRLREKAARAETWWDQRTFAYDASKRAGDAMDLHCIREASAPLESSLSSDDDYPEMDDRELHGAREIDEEGE